MLVGMKWVLAIVSVLMIGAAGFWWYGQVIVEPAGSPQYLPSEQASTTSEMIETTVPPVEVVAENLSIPWEVLFLPDGELLVTERPGTLLLLKQGLEIPVPGIEHIGEGGLLGAVLHPNFTENNFLYLYQTTATPEGLRNRINRYTLKGEELLFESTIVADLPGARYHDGGRIALGPDELLYVTVGDAGDAPAAQNPDNRAGSILRYTLEGDIPEDNPFENAVYSYGHRNPQGLAWDGMGKLWSSEHGRSGVRSGFDEINAIAKGGNYGWPDSEGDVVADGTIAPERHSTADTTWAPGGLAYHNGSLYMPGLRGATLYEAVVDNGSIVAWHEHLMDEYGRLRTVVVGADGLLYVTTSNRDGRGAPPSRADDRIIRIDPAQLERDS
jgi:glucose/arabinose dehydrogenase